MNLFCFCKSTDEEEKKNPIRYRLTLIEFNDHKNKLFSKD
jgi:hypothetical protein